MTIKAELELIRNQHGGSLTAASALRYAEVHKASALHKRIAKAGLWDNDKAARRARLLFCQQLILRVRVRVLVNGHKESYRAYVNVLGTRRAGTGYASVVELMRSKGGRESILETALYELQAFQKKYSMFEELAEVFSAIRNVANILL